MCMSSTGSKVKPTALAAITAQNLCCRPEDESELYAEQSGVGRRA